MFILLNINPQTEFPQNYLQSLNEHYYQQNKSLKEYFFNTKSTKNSLWFLFVYLLVFITIKQNKKR